MENSDKIDNPLPCSRGMLGEKRWRNIVSSKKELQAAEDVDWLAAHLESLTEQGELPDYLAELARFEAELNKLGRNENIILDDDKEWKINPTLYIAPTKWNIAEVLNRFAHGSAVVPQGCDEHFALAWFDPRTRRARIKSASQEDLFALKILADEIPFAEVSETAGKHPDSIHNTICRARNQGLVVGREPSIRRGKGFCAAETPKNLDLVHNFVLQWHITNACDLHCKHCYDRSRRSPMTLEQGMDVLNNMGEFCRLKNCGGHICFSGGNPLMSPHFFDLYGEASDRGHGVSILGNPCTRNDLERICEIQPPSYYQVSLEGLPEHNDAIRGRGFFARVIEFLGLLRDFDVDSVVMLTLTRDNMDQVLPLAERLRGHTDEFAFNRLSPVGEGAALAMPPVEDYVLFLKDYQAAREENPILNLKDNLFNIVLHNQGLDLFDGCTGYGCGAAFNFLSVLPDGEVHACRKFPSPVGNVFDNSLLSIYDGEASQRYRARPEECRDCELSPSCGGCLVVADGSGLDPFKQKDPYCFKD